MAEEPERVDLSTPDIAADNREALAVLFPGVLADGVLDATRLGELLDVDVTSPADGRERFGLMWAGKHEALQSLGPSRGTLVPDLGKSINFDTARNVFIDGDNLEVLKLMQKAYNDKVKLIYIDPPYNTGNDFVYADDFSDSLHGYLEYTRQVDHEGNRTSASADTVGRRHSRWLSMMFPRLHLARNLLTQDGVLAVSIDANEVAHLRSVLDEVFGEENYLNTITWVSNLKGRQISNGGAVGTHEYVLVYARDFASVEQFRGNFDELKAMMPSVYKGAGYNVKHDDNGPYVTKNQLYNSNSKFNEVTAPTMVFRVHFNPTTEEVRVTDLDDETTFPGFLMTMPHSNSRPDLSWHAWRWSRAKILAESEDLEFRAEDENLQIWSKIRDVTGVAIKDLVIGPSTMSAKADLERLGLERVFDTPKPVDLLRVLIGAVTGSDDLVLDFFAGSASTAHATAAQNEVDGGQRRCITVNLPEPTPEDSEAAKMGFATVSEIAIERIRRVLDGSPPAQDAGLRVMALAESNFRASNDEPGSLFDLSAETLVAPLNDVDAVVAEILLREGVRLESPWERTTVASAPVVMSDGVAVISSLDLDDDVVAAALELETRVLVFLEDGFAGSDALKANAFTRARELGIMMKTV